MNPKTGAAIIGVGIFLLLLLNVQWGEVSGMVRAYTVLAMGIVSVGAFVAVQGSEGEGIEIGTEIAYHAASGIAAAVIVGSLLATLGGFPFWFQEDWSDRASADFRLKSHVLTEAAARVIANETSMEIDVIAWDRPEISVNGTISVYASSREKAEEYLNQTEVRLTREVQDGLPVFQVLVEGPDRSFSGYRGHSLLLTIMVPASSKLDLNIKSESGDMTVQGVNMGQGILKGTSGDVALEAVDAESLEISLVSGSIEGELASASADIRTISGRIDLAIGRLTGSYTLRSTSGSIVCEVPMDDDVGLSLEGSTTSGEVEFSVGDIALSSDRRNQREGRTPGYDSKGVQILISGRTVSGNVRVTRVES